MSPDADDALDNGLEVLVGLRNGVHQFVELVDVLFLQVLTLLLLGFPLLVGVSYEVQGHIDFLTLPECLQRGDILGYVVVLLLDLELPIASPVAKGGVLVRADDFPFSLGEDSRT